MLARQSSSLSVSLEFAPSILFKKDIQAVIFIFFLFDRYFDVFSSMAPHYQAPVYHKRKNFFVITFAEISG